MNSSKLDNYIELFAALIADIVITEAHLPHFEKRPRGYFTHKLHPGLRYIDLSLFKLLKNIDERSNEVGFIGRLEEEKGIIDFIKLVRLVVIKAKQFKINVSFYVVGNGKLELLVKNTVARFLSEGINIRFHGFIENKLLPNVLNETKILVLPYKSPAEGIPTTILEAFACGTPVIAYDTGLISLIVRNQVTGFVVPRGNYKAVADLILKLLSNQSVLSRISYNQRKFAEASLSFEKAINRYLLLMKRLYSKK